MLGSLVTGCLCFAAAVSAGIGVWGVWHTRRDMSRNSNCAWCGVIGLLGVFLGVMAVCDGIAHAQARQEISDLREYIRRI